MLFHCLSHQQATNHPWLGLLLTGGESDATYSRCATTMVVAFFCSVFNKMETVAGIHVVMTQQTNDFAVFDISFLNPVPSQIGSNIFLTAAHCLINDSDEVFSPSELKILIGVRNKRKLTSTARSLNSCFMYNYQLRLVSIRHSELHITKVVLHERFNFTQQIHDIALLKTST